MVSVVGADTVILSRWFTHDTCDPLLFVRGGQRVELGVFFNDNMVLSMIYLLCKSGRVDTGHRVFEASRLVSFLQTKDPDFASDIVTQLESSEEPSVYVWHTSNHWQITVAHKIGNTVWVRRRNSSWGHGKQMLKQTVKMIGDAYRICDVLCPTIEVIEQPKWVTQQVPGSNSCGLHVAGNTYLALSGELDHYYLTHKMIQRIRRFTVEAYMMKLQKLAQQQTRCLSQVEPYNTPRAHEHEPSPLACTTFPLLVPWTLSAVEDQMEKLGRTPPTDIVSMRISSGREVSITPAEIQSFCSITRTFRSQEGVGGCEINNRKKCIYQPLFFFPTGREIVLKKAVEYRTIWF